MSDFLRVYEDTDDRGQMFYAVEHRGEVIGALRDWRVDYDYPDIFDRRVGRGPCTELSYTLKVVEIPIPPKPKRDNSRARRYGLRRPSENP